MKILFICGCIEPGKDGVGDYTQRLCAELKRQDVSVGIIAFRDSCIENIQETNQEVEGVSIPCLRLPESLGNKERMFAAKEWVDYQNPDWLSLQFVPYSFNNKGLPFGLGSALKKIGGDRKWHVMFHELWLGLRDNDSLKFRIIGFFQKNIVKSLVSKIKVKSVHTHTQFYLNELVNLDLSPKYLPIFSNIPFVSNSLNKKNSKEVQFVIFGTIHPNVRVSEFAIEMFNYFKNIGNYNYSLILIGNSGSEKGKWVKEFESKQINVIVKGELASEDISYALQDASFGITTNPIFVAEKSGTVAAMREHNLPIIVVSEKTSPKSGFKLDSSFGFKEYKVGNFSELMKKNQVRSTNKGLAEISIQFLIDLKD